MKRAGRERAEDHIVDDLGNRLRAEHHAIGFRVGANAMMHAKRAFRGFAPEPRGNSSHIGNRPPYR